MMPRYDYAYFFQGQPILFAIIVFIVVFLVGLALFMDLSQRKKKQKSVKKPMTQANKTKAKQS